MPRDEILAQFETDTWQAMNECEEEEILRVMRRVVNRWIERAEEQNDFELQHGTGGTGTYEPPIQTYKARVLNLGLYKLEEELAGVGWKEWRDIC